MGVKTLSNVVTPIFRATGPAAATNNAVVTWQSKDLDTANAFNPATGVFTAPRPGIYAFRASVLTNTNGGGPVFAFRKNGSIIRGRATYSDGIANHEQTGSHLEIRLAVGDTVDLYATRGLYVENADSSAFSGQWISA